MTSVKDFKRLLRDKSIRGHRMKGSLVEAAQEAFEETVLEIAEEIKGKKAKKAPKKKGDKDARND